MTRTPAPMPPMEDLHRRLRTWAKGSFPLEAGVELLIRSGYGYRGDVWEVAGSWSHEHLRAWVDGDLLSDALTGRGPHLLNVSGGERRLLSVAASLLDGPGVDLNDALPGLDRGHLDLVLAAMSHAGGAHEHGNGFVTDAKGTPIALRPGYQPPLHPWPSR